ncbi:hypothetical protein [Fulvimarina sp. MAC3]|uniref:hypothetical protein n=1 Tax=Fulvimarina sp. MAC3 TaxID=3148887 RepID=UPI0031FBF3EC
MTNSAGNGEAGRLSPWIVRMGLALMVAFVAVVSFGGVAGWLTYGEAIFLNAVAEGWALCF